MDNNNFPADFISYWFTYNDDQYKLACSPEFKVNRGELDFTGNFIGILISAKKGTQTFIEDKHQDKIFECPKCPLNEAPDNFPEELILRSFEFHGDIYKLVIVPEFGAWEEGSGLDFSGCYEGVLVSCKTGTVMFQVEPGEDGFDIIGEGIESGLESILSDFILELRSEKILA